MRVLPSSSTPLRAGPLATRAAISSSTSTNPAATSRRDILERASAKPVATAAKSAQMLPTGSGEPAAVPAEPPAVSPFWDPYATPGQPTTEQLVAAQEVARSQTDPAARDAIMQGIDAAYEYKKNLAVAAGIEKNWQEAQAAGDLLASAKAKAEGALRAYGFGDAVVASVLNRMDEEFNDQKTKAMWAGTALTSFTSTLADQTIASSQAAMYADMRNTGISEAAWKARQFG